MKTQTYTRIIPRDLFNEAKLLKCIGRLCLIIGDKMAPDNLSFEHEGDKFNIELNEGDGGIYITNLIFSISDYPVHFQTSMNAKDAYPLYCTDQDDNEYCVFEENGEFTTEFINFCKSLE